MLDAAIGRATSTADAEGNTCRSGGYACVTDARSSAHITTAPVGAPPPSAVLKPVDPCLDAALVPYSSKTSQ